MNIHKSILVFESKVFNPCLTSNSVLSQDWVVVRKKCGVWACSDDQHVSEQENRTNSVLLTGLEFNCTVRDFLCPSHLIPIDLNVIRNWVQFLVMIGFSFSWMWYPFGQQE